MHKKFDINQTKIKGDCQSGRKVLTHDSKSDLPLAAKTARWNFQKSYTINNLEVENHTNANFYCEKMLKEIL